MSTARRELLSDDNELVRSAWHLARVWVGPTGGGPVVGGGVKRSMLPATHGTKALLSQKSQVPVASPEIFVGRRRPLQHALRVLRGRDHAGVLLHGMGRHGKSSLAARIADRRPDLAFAVVYGHYDAVAVIDALADTLGAHQPARDLLEQRRSEVRNDPSKLKPLLVDLLTNHCTQTGSGQPVLLVIDDLERILTRANDGAHRVSTHTDVIAAVLQAFDPARTDSRVLVIQSTSVPPRRTRTHVGVDSAIEAVGHRRPQTSSPPDRRRNRPEPRRPSRCGATA